MKRILSLLLLLATLISARAQEIVTLPNVAALQAADPRLLGRRDGDGVIRATVHLRGYATDSDGGGGEVSWADGSTEAADDGLVFESESAYQDGRWLRSRTAGYVTPAMFGMFGIEGVGQSLLAVADSRMSTNTYAGTSSWSEFTNNFAAFAVAGGKMTFTLRASPSGSQSVQLSGSSIRSPGLGEASARYLVRLTARVTAGTAVELAIGKSFVTGGMAFRFTPTNTATVFTGYFDGGDTTQSLYLGLATNNASNGSSYEIDDVEIYYAGDSSTLTEVPDAEDAPDEGERFQAMLDSARGAPGRFEFPPNRIFRADGGGFVAWDGAQIALNNSELYLSGIDGDSGLRFTSFGTLTRGKVRGAYLSSASDKGLIQAGVAQSEASPVGRIVMSDLFITDDATNTHVSLLIFGSHNAEVRNIEFADTAFTRRQVNVVWAGASTLVLGYNPAINVLIENIYAGNSGQNYPAEGGGCVVGINGIVNCYIRNVYADSVGRSLVDLGTGDWYDTRFAPPLLNSSLATCVIDNCSVANGLIGFRVDGTAYLSSTLFAPLTVSIRNCFSRSSGGYLGVGSDAGVLINPSVANITVKDSTFIGHRHGVQVTNQFVVPTADAFSRDITVENNVIRDSKLSGIYLLGATDTKILNNHIYNSGVDGFASYRQGIWASDYNTNVVIRGNFIGEVNETTTNQTTGIEVTSNARNHAIAVDANYVFGTAASGTPLNLGASATYSLRGANYVGTPLTVLGYSGTPSTGQIPVFTNAAWTVMSPGSSGIGGSTGSTDNSLLRADGTGGSTLQSSAVIIDDYTSSTANNVALKVDDGSTANIAAVITPKGNGAFILGPKPDGTTTGGNARGQYAVDLQMSRAAAGTVASGNYSFAAGRTATASGNDSMAVGNFSSASATGAYALANNATVSGQYAAVLGGYGSQATAQQSVFLAGAGVASAVYAVGAGEAAANKRGQFGISGGSFAAGGDSQSSIITVRNSTSSTSATELFTDGSSGRLTLANNSAWTFEAKVTGITSGAAASYSYILTGFIRRGANAADTTMPAAVTKTVIHESNAAADVDATADTTNGSLKIAVTAYDSTATRWSATVIWNQVGY